MTRPESRSSKAYEAGKAIRYSGRIHGPTFEVTTYPIDDLPDDSALRNDAVMATWFAEKALTNDIDLGTKLGTGKAYE